VKSGNASVPVQKMCLYMVYRAVYKLSFKCIYQVVISISVGYLLHTVVYYSANVPIYHQLPNSPSLKTRVKSSNFTGPLHLHNLYNKCYTKIIGESVSCFCVL